MRQFRDGFGWFGQSVNAGIVMGGPRFPWNKQVKSAAKSSGWHQFGHATQIQHKHEHQSKSNSTMVPSGRNRYARKRHQSVAAFRQISQCPPFAGKHHHSGTNGPLWESRNIVSFLIATFHQRKLHHNHTQRRMC